MNPDINLKQYTNEESITRVAENLRAGVHFSERGLLVRDGCQNLAFSVTFRSATKRINIIDNGMRPPEPGGIWIDDLLSASCRHVFGVKRGSCRKIQGTDHFEFREFWHDPTRYKVIENVKVEYAPSMQRPSDIVKVETSAYPGADVASVVFASAYQCIERKFGGGTLEWVPNKDCVLRFEANPEAIVNTLVPCRYTIITNGGRSQEIVIYVPHDLTRSWDALKLAVTTECRKKIGPGTISYMPELGECTFQFK